MPRPEDIHIGKRIRHRRKIVKMTQQQLAEKSDVKFQQIQKYETGMNRVSGSRMLDIARTLSVHPAYFFEGLDTPSATSEIQTPEEADLLMKYRQSSPTAQSSILRIAQETAQVCA